MGSHVELGLALAFGKKIYLYSEEEILPEEAASFYYVDGVEHVFGDIEKLVSAVPGLEETT